jgi:putative oxidoreductase
MASRSPYASAAEDVGKLVLRFALGVLILLHGADKILHGAGFVLDMVAKHGLPRELGYLVYAGEVLAPAMLILGLWTRPAALALAVNMVVAVWLVHTGELFTRAQSGGWALELQGMYFAAALALVFTGGGRWSVTRRWS